MRIPETIASLKVPVSKVRPYQGNPRRGDIEAIKESLETNGQYRPVVANRRTGEVLAGNHTLQAAKALGWPEIAVTWVDVDEEQAARIVLVDNRTNDLAGYDEAALADLLSGLPDLAGTGYDQAALADLLVDELPSFTDQDEPGALPERDPICRVGEVWDLGESMLLVGDATDTVSVADMLDGERADCVWTDPPYGVNYVGKTKDALTIENDSAADLPGLLLGAFQTVIACSRPGAPVYVAYSDNENVTFHAAMTEAGLLVRQHLVWVKPTMVLGGSDYQYRHEPIWQAQTPGEPDEGTPADHEGVAYGFTPGGQGRLGRGGPNWFGDNRATTVFEVAKPSANRDHPTMKPVELIDRMLANSLRPGGLVLDVFGGSGSTLIAAYHRRSRAALVELDPRYADAICRRFQEHTGVMPVRRADSVPVDFCREEQQ